ncbi:Major Facilitator Superfamily protein [Planctomycetes bacterium Pla163]|uniref:Major Facilitator Superfamily protein n=1 Tax=Rohdeia mirabilis TaxID=2528008 RepID=A0A518CVZ2_9BACT|nr:Major Facilitator Superfamily protein [Planctomycetes bacterium Pla163]
MNERPGGSGRSERLGPEEVQRGLRLSVAEGAAFAIMVGLGETYIIADAVRLGASTLMLGLLVSLPLFVGSLGPFLCLRLLARVTKRRRRIVVAANVLQALNLVALAAVELAGAGTPTLLLAAYALHQLLGQAAGTAWTSWFGDLIPAEVRGSYVARRNRVVYGAIGVGILVGGLLLQWLEPADSIASGTGGIGFALLFALAGIARGISALLSARTPEPPFAGMSTGPRVRRFLFTERGTRARRLILLVFAIQFTVYLSSPFYTPFMLEDLQLSYVEFTVASLMVMGVKVGILPSIGRAIDQFGPRSTFCMTLILLALVPLPWVFATGFWVIFAAQCFSGLAWGGYEVSLFGLLVGSSYRGTRAQVSAVQQLANGSAQLLGAMAGAGIVALASGDLRVIFAVSCAARLLVAFAAPIVLPAGIGETSVGPHRLLLRVVGFRSGGGIALRPVGGLTEDPEVEVGLDDEDPPDDGELVGADLVRGDGSEVGSAEPSDARGDESNGSRHAPPGSTR